MKTKISFLLLFLSTYYHAVAQNPILRGGFPNEIMPVGTIKNVDDNTLLEIVQRQTFRYFWHCGHPVSGLARKRSNTVHSEYYWGFINEA